MKSNPPSLTRLETALRQSPHAALPPADLHDSILTAVRSTAKVQPAQPSGRRAVAVMFALAVVACAWLIVQRPWDGKHSLGGVDLALQNTRNVPAQASAAMLAPLSQELELLNRDFRGAMDFVAASVP